MATRKISITLLICIAHEVLSAASFGSAAVKAPSSVSTSNAFSSTEDAIIGATNISTKADLKADASTGVQHQIVGKRAASPIATNNYDGRSAYINNQYIDDKAPATTYNDTSPPLYQFLQEQMEHILASSLPGEYQLQHNQANTETSADAGDGAAEKDIMVNGYGVAATQINTNNSPVFGYGAENYEIADDTIHDSYAGIEKEESYSKPETLELPKPIDIGTTTANDFSSRAEGSNAVNATKVAVAADTELPTGSYGGSISSTQSQHHNQQALADSGYGAQFQNYKSHIIRQHSSTPSKYSYMHENSTLHMRKRRIIFKTISSSSQIISTPLADLLFKFSIGMAKPSVAASANSLNEREPLHDSISTSHKDNLNLPKIPQPSSLGSYGS